MRVLKLAALALFGYAVYEFFQGILHDTHSGAAGRRASRGGARALGSGTPGTVLSGPGEGVDEATFDSDGGTLRHRVGRGVVH